MPKGVVKVRIEGDNRDLSKKLDQSAKKTSDFGKHATEAVGVAALFEFGKASVEAFNKAEHAELALQNTLKNNPKLIDTNVEEWKKYSLALEGKTAADHTSIESGIAVLGNFNLSSEQIKKAIPVVLDYARKTGRDVPDAAKLVGKALLGNARALKEVGIALPKAGQGAKDVAKADATAARADDQLAKARQKLADTEAVLAGKKKLTVSEEIRLRNAQQAVTDAAAKQKAAHEALAVATRTAGASADSFGLVIDGLKSKVGGFAEAEGKTAEGRLAQMKNKFEDLKQEIGAVILPILLKLFTVLLGIMNFIQSHQRVIKDLAIGLALVVGPIIAINKAMAIWRRAQEGIEAARAAWTRLAGGIGISTAAQEAQTAAAAADATALDADVAATLALAEAQTGAAAATGEATAAMEAQGAAAATTGAATGGLAAGLGAIASKAIPLIGALVAVKVGYAGIKRGMELTKEANQATTNDFLSHTIPTLLQTGRTLEITASQWRSGPFGGSDIKKVGDIFDRLHRGVISYAQAFDELSKVAGVSKSAILDVAKATIEGSKKSGNYASVITGVVTAINNGLGTARDFAGIIGKDTGMLSTLAGAFQQAGIPASQLSDLLRTLGIKGDALKRVLNSLSGKYKAEVDIAVNVKATKGKTVIIQGPSGPYLTIDPHLVGHRARGGAVEPYHDYIVGEEQQELLRMGSNGGTVIPLGGGRKRGRGASGSGSAEFDHRAFAAAIAQEVARALHGLSVEMDGERVGRLVSRSIGARADLIRRGGWG